MTESRDFPRKSALDRQGLLTNNPRSAATPFGGIFSLVATQTSGKQTRRPVLVFSKPLNQLGILSGGVPEWLKGTDCKSVGYAYAGSNPAPSTTLRSRSGAMGVPRTPDPVRGKGDKASASYGWLTPVKVCAAEGIEVRV